MYTICISDRKYTEWNIIPSLEIDPSVEIDPFSQKLFHQDIFETTNVKIISSPTRSVNYLSGILILENNRTFGRTPNKKKLYYSCIPYQKELPVFLIPYEIQLGFHKNIKNKYVLFKFDHWNDKHPCGILTHTIGDVDHLPHYYEYQLYSKQIYPSTLISKNNKKIKGLLQNTSLQYYIQYILDNSEIYGTIIREEEKEQRIFTIDPVGCKDRDDALSICKTYIPHIFKISVYIANVWVWLKTFDLWEILENTNISTIYLPDFNRHMLPTELSEKICSLDISHPCFTFCLEFQVNILEKTILPIGNLSQKCISISQNFDYESKSLFKYPSYQLLLQITREIKPEITDSHDLVAFWMMQMNTCIANEMYTKKMGIFRITEGSSSFTEGSSSFTEGTSSFTEGSASFTEGSAFVWENVITGKYIEYSSSSTNYYHAALDVNNYMHFTSPIRRKVDIYNQLLWVRMNLNIDINNINIDMDKINKDTKKIRKVQNECTLLHLLELERDSDSDSSNTITNGIIIQKQKHKQNNKYLVYLPIYKCILSCKSLAPIELYTHVKCKIFVFERESDYKRKIQISIL
jgi:exoribonuclease R